MASSGVWREGQYILVRRTGEPCIVRGVRTYTDPKTGARRTSLDVHRVPGKGQRNKLVQLRLFGDRIEVNG